MATKSKSLFLFLLLTILVLVFVLSIKFFKVDNSEEISAPVNKIAKIVKAPKRTVHLENTQSDEEDNDPIELPHKVQRENNIKNANDALNKAMMYNTPEKVMKAIIYYQETGDDAKAEEFINYLLETFPDYEMSL